MVVLRSSWCTSAFQLSSRSSSRSTVPKALYASTRHQDGVHDMLFWEVIQQVCIAKSTVCGHRTPRRCALMIALCPTRCPVRLVSEKHCTLSSPPCERETLQQWCSLYAMCVPWLTAGCQPNAQKHVAGELSFCVAIHTFYH
eukprot:scaffold122475_cov22-Tisochrysis_lutea.AAC.1